MQHWMVRRGGVCVTPAASPGVGAHIRKMEGHTGYIYGVFRGPDGALGATASRDGTARLWHAATGACVC